MTRRRLGQLQSHSGEQTEAFGEALGRLLEPGHVVGLVGELGAGKTCFVRGVARGVQVPPQIQVSSPTFTLINEYPGRVLLVHADFYRLGDAQELVELGIDEYLGGDCACVIEWFDRFADALPPPVLLLRYEVVGDHQRMIHLAATDVRHQALGRAWIDALQP